MFLTSGGEEKLETCIYWIPGHAQHAFVGFDPQEGHDGEEEVVEASMIWSVRVGRCMGSDGTDMLVSKRNTWRTLSDPYADTYQTMLYLTMKRIIWNIGWFVGFWAMDRIVSWGHAEATEMVQLPSTEDKCFDWDSKELSTYVAHVCIFWIQQCPKVSCLHKIV